MLARGSRFCISDAYDAGTDHGKPYEHNNVTEPNHLEHSMLRKLIVYMNQGTQFNVPSISTKFPELQL
jgi:hypothetical protein